MEKWIAAFLQIAAAILLFVAGAIGDEESVLLLVPALIAGVAGLLLWSRDRAALPPSPVATRAEPPLLEAKVHRIEDTLFALQAEISHLREDREFFNELYPERAQRPSLKS